MRVLVSWVHGPSVQRVALGWFMGSLTFYQLTPLAASLGNFLQLHCDFCPQIDEVWALSKVTNFVHCSFIHSSWFQRLGRLEDNGLTWPRGPRTDPQQCPVFHPRAMTW